MPEKVELPPLPLTGGCQCGKVRYRVEGAPVAFYLCHCRECQRHTSSAFGESLWVARADLVVEGEVRRTTRVSDAGRLREGWFCPECGVRIFHGSEGSEKVTVKAGTLDDTSWLSPAGHIWTRAKQRFVAIGAGEIVHEGEPDPEMTTIAARWREMVAGM